MNILEYLREHNELYDTMTKGIYTKAQEKLDKKQFFEISDGQLMLMQILIKTENTLSKIEDTLGGIKYILLTALLLSIYLVFIK